jgi:hypothetical protein
LFAAAGLLAACPDRSISEVNPAQGRVEAKDIPIKVNRDLDLLFLIDNSPSMNDKQINLTDNFMTFIQVLSGIPGGLPNVHIGVATSDLGTRGADGVTQTGTVGTITKGGCSGAGDDGRLKLSNNVTTLDGAPYLSDIQPDDPTQPRQRNYTGDLNDVFKSLARVGAGGCGFEQHLEGVQRALDNNPANTGFLRPEAFLAVIIIADEDDCSMEHTTLLGPDSQTLGARQSFRCTRFGVLCDQGGTTTDAMNVVGNKSQCHPADDSAYLTKVASYADFLKGLKPDDPNKVIVAGIMGTSDKFAVELRAPTQNAPAIPALAHSCSYTGGDGLAEVADPPIRLKFFLDQFPNRNTFATICQQDLSGGLQQIAELLKASLGDPCIEGKLANPPNYDCSVSAIVNPGASDQQETVLPRCDASSTNAPCWHILVDATQCKNSPDNLLLKIEGQDKLQTDTHIVANCVTEVTSADAGP